MCKIGNIGVKVLKKHENAMIGVRVELTKKTTITGEMIYAVVVTNMNTGYHYRIYTFKMAKLALEAYKAALA